MKSSFYIMSESEIADINGGGWLSAVAVTVLGVALTVTTIATVPAATPAVVKGVIALGGAISTGTGAVSAWND